MNPVIYDGRSFRDVSLGDTIENFLKPKRAPTRREKLGLADGVPTPPSSPTSDTSPPPQAHTRRLRPATRKSRARIVKAGKGKLID